MLPYSNCKVEEPHFNTKEGRRYINITRPNGTRFSMPYARYKMELHLGYYLDPSEDVHHKDENKRNDDLDNLEVKGHGDHARDHKTKYTVELVICPECIDLFELTPAKASCAVHMRQKNPDYAGPFCCATCANKYNGRVRRSV